MQKMKVLIILGAEGEYLYFSKNFNILARQLSKALV
jgi:hypothetical protein